MIVLRTFMLIRPHSHLTSRIISSYAKMQTKIAPEKKERRGRNDQMMNVGNKIRGKETDMALKEEEMDYKRYGRQVKEILQSKKQLLDVDLAFLAQKIAQNELTLDHQLSNFLKHHFKMLKEANFSLLPALLDLGYAVGIITPPQLFLHSYLEHLKKHPFRLQEQQKLGFPSYFLKRVGSHAVLLCLGRSIEEGASSLRFFGSILSLNQLKTVDEQCIKILPTMTPDHAARMLAIFRQLRKRGAFVEQAQEFLIQKQAELSPKALITTVLSLLQLESRQGVGRLEQRLCMLVSGGGFTENEVVSLMHVFHKYKAGGEKIWQEIQTFMVKRYQKVPFQHLFLLMSGHCRNYRLNGTLLQQLIGYDSTLAYAQNLQEKQFVEFYFVLYAHYTALSTAQKQQYQKLLISTIKNAKLNSVYKEIQSFLLFLLEPVATTKKEYLRTAYPDDTLIALLSIIYSFPNTDVREQQAYQSDLISRCGNELWQHAKEILVAQQFIRYKLISTMQRERVRPSEQ